MLSILIPTYNYPVFTLVSELKAQCESAHIAFEIISYDDGSALYHEENDQVNNLEHCSYKILETNIGRSRIRNLLAKNAVYDNLLFLDADVIPVKDDFIASYIRHAGENAVVSGGLRYREDPPEKELLLRWHYGSAREVMPLSERKKQPYQSFLSSNFMMPKLLFETMPFNETIPDLRREDTLFSYNLMQNKARIIHIDNPVYHLGLDAFSIAIRKEQESLQGLFYMLHNGLLPDSYLKMSRLFGKIRNAKMTNLVASLHQMGAPIILRNLSSQKPSLLLFDLYRIGYLCAHAKKSA